MSSQSCPTRITSQEYLSLERVAVEKSEYFEGEVFAMVGASRRHNLISLNVARRLDEQLDGRGCEVYVSDMRVTVAITGLYTYADVAFRQYLLVAQDRCHVERYTRQSDSEWTFWETDDIGETVELSVIGCRLRLADVYAKIELAEKDGPEG